MSVVHSRGTLRIAVTLAVVTSLAWGCDPSVKPSQSGPSPSAGALASPSDQAGASDSASPSESAAASGSVEPSASVEPSSSASGQASSSPTVGPTPSPTPITVRFTQAIADHRWGDPAFRVRAAATGGRVVRFAADGGCRVDGNGLVTIQSVGQCRITASYPGVKPMPTASRTFRILRANPVITVRDQSTKFANPMKYQVRVTVSPTIPLKYTIKHKTAEDAWCKVNSTTGILTFSHQPTSGSFPQIPLDCYVQVAAAASSPNYTAPAADTAKITIGYATFNVVPKPKDIDYSVSPSVTFDIQELSGAALGMDVQVNGGNCTVSAATPVHPTTKTTRYKVTVTAGASATYDCDFTATALPLDYFKGNREATFTVHVTP